MANLNPNLLQYTDPTASTIPSDGPKAIPLLLNFSVAASFDLDLTNPIDQKKISMVQTIYMDLSNASDDLIITVGGSNQIVRGVAKTQGYYNVLAPYPARFNFANASGSDLIPVFLINVPVPGVVWSAT